MHARGAGFDRGNAVDDRQVTIAVTVPIHADIGVVVLDHLHRESHDGRRAPGRGVTDGIGEADAVRAGVNRALV